jgi:hypothetical protein
MKDRGALARPLLARPRRCLHLTLKTRSGNVANQLPAAADLTYNEICGRKAKLNGASGRVAEVITFAAWNSMKLRLFRIFGAKIR